MRRAGRLVRRVLDRLKEMTQPGATARELNAEAERMCSAGGAQCLFKGVPSRYGGGPFPGAICISFNEQVVHGVPTERVVRDGDIVSVDFGVRLDGWCGDAADTYVVGNVLPDVRRLVDVTRNAFLIALGMVRPKARWSDIARAMQDYVENEGFSVVREFVGHGIGRQMWEAPKVPNFVSPELEGSDIILAEGMVLAVEPMVNMGTAAVELAADRWTVVTKDRRPSAHYEHTIAVTGHGADVLTDGR